MTFYNLKLGYFHPTLLLRALNDGPQGVRYNESWLYSDQWYILAIFHFWNWPASARQLVCVNQCKRTRFAAKMRRRRRQAPVPIKSISRNINQTQQFLSTEISKLIVLTCNRVGMEIRKILNGHYLHSFFLFSNCSVLKIATHSARIQKIVVFSPILSGFSCFHAWKYKTHVFFSLSIK